MDGSLVWPDLTPPEYQALDEFAHEEGLRFGAFTGDGCPIVGELIRAVTNLFLTEWHRVICLGYLVENI